MSRPSDTGHTPFGDIFVSQSEDMIYWGRHRMGAQASGEDPDRARLDEPHPAGRNARRRGDG